MDEILSNIQYRSLKINWVFRCLIYSVLYTVFTFLIYLFMGIIIGILQFVGFEVGFLYRIASNELTSFLMIYLLTFIIIKIFEKSRLLPRLGFEKSNIFKKYAIGFAIGTVLILISAMPIMLFFTTDISLAEPILWGKISWYLMFFIIQGAAEEVLVRGMVFPVIVKESRPITALVLTSVTFGLMHFFNPSFTVLGFLNITLAGLVFGYCVLYFDSLWQACALHTAWNFVQGVVLGFGVSGLQMPSLIVMKTEGKEFFTGGMFGVEGSIFSLIVLSASLIIFHVLCVKKGINIFGKTKIEVTTSNENIVDLVN